MTVRLVFAVRVPALLVLLSAQRRPPCASGCSCRNEPEHVKSSESLRFKLLRLDLPREPKQQVFFSLCL